MGEVLRPGLARTADEMIDAIRSAVPAYARPLDGAFGAGIRTGVVRALEQFVSAVEGARRRPPGARDIYFELGRGEAREGRALEALLSAYRVGARVAWRNAAASAREAGLGAEVLAPLAESVFAFIDQLSARSAEGYAFEQSVTAGAAAGRRHALVQLMVSRPPADAAAVEEAAREAAWPLPATLAAVVWRGPAEPRATARLPLGSVVAVLADDTACALVPDAAAPGPAPGAGPRSGRRTRRRGPCRSLAGDLAERRAGRLRAAAGRGRPSSRPSARSSPTATSRSWRCSGTGDCWTTWPPGASRHSTRGPRALARACWRRSGAGSTTRAGSRTWRRTFTYIPRPCATASDSCGRRSDPPWTIRTRGSD